MKMHYVSYTNVDLAITTVCMLATYLQVAMSWVFSYLLTHYIANHSVNITFILHGTTDHLFPDNYYIAMSY